MATNDTASDHWQHELELFRIDPVLEQKIENHERTITDHEQTIADHEKTIAEHQRTIADFQATIAHREDLVKWHRNDLERLAKEVDHLRELSKKATVKIPKAGATSSAPQSRDDQQPNPVTQSTERGVKRVHSSDALNESRKVIKTAPESSPLQSSETRLVHISSGLPSMCLALDPGEDGNSVSIWRINNLPSTLQELRTGIIQQFECWRSTAPAKISIFSNTDNSFAGCMDSFVRGKVSANPVRGCACDSCADNQLPCIVRRNRTFVVLPLPPDARLQAAEERSCIRKLFGGAVDEKMDVGPEDICYWLAPIQRINERFKQVNIEVNEALRVVNSRYG